MIEHLSDIWHLRWAHQSPEKTMTISTEEKETEIDREQNTFNMDRKTDCASLFGAPAVKRWKSTVIRVNKIPSIWKWAKLMMLHFVCLSLARFFSEFLFTLFLRSRQRLSQTQNFMMNVLGFLFCFIGAHSDGVQITVDFRLFHSEFNFLLLRSCSKEWKDFQQKKFIKQQLKRKCETMPSCDKKKWSAACFFTSCFLRIVLRIQVDVVVLSWNGSVSAKMKNTFSFWCRDEKKHTKHSLKYIIM